MSLIKLAVKIIKTIVLNNTTIAI